MISLRALCYFLLVFLAGACGLHAAPYSAFQNGERFRYRVSWGVFSKAGEIELSARQDTLEGRPVMRVKMLTSTRGFIRGLYSFDEEAEVTIDLATSRILQVTDLATQAKKVSDALTRFDYEKREFEHRDLIKVGKNKKEALPEGDPIDLLSALVGTRDWARAPGLAREVLIFAGRDLYPVTIRSEALETLKIEGKEHRVLLLVPRMEKTQPRGPFKKGGEVRVWLSQDENPRPLRMQLRLKIGTAQLTLLEHQPASARKQHPIAGVGEAGL